MNIGPVKTFRMMKEILGGYDNVGASKQDFKNFHRDLKTFIQGSDAQMFVDNFTKKKLMWSAFFFILKLMMILVFLELFGRTLFVKKIMLCSVI